jgi:hypothetical protein
MSGLAMIGRWLALMCVTLGLAACTTAPVVIAPADSLPDTSPTTTAPATTAPTTTPPTTTGSATVPPHPPVASVTRCLEADSTPPPIDGDAVDASRAVAERVVCASTDVVVAAPDDPELAAASRAAAYMGAPLVYADTERPFDPTGIEAARVWTADPGLVLPGRHTVLPLPNEDAPLPTLVETLDGKAVDEDGRVVSEVMEAVTDATEPAPTLLVLSSSRPDLAASVAGVAESVGGAAVWARPGDMRRRRALRSFAAVAVDRHLVGDFWSSASWQLDVLAAGTELPGGGQVLFPGKRLVALYGHPYTSALGVLGEQGVEAAVERAARLADPYATGDVTVIPTFEIIATTASALPGEDGDYSAELSVEDLRPWVDAAAEADYYVVLDLQPGRTDFLTQARRYEDLLKLPHVGLALDPEWRLGPDQVHLRQIGSVSAAEVNQVTEWLAELVRRERLPQKLLLVHQFKLSMITERQDLISPSELALVIQMDGQGPLGTKYDTWEAILPGASDRWHWGWKNFYDEDSPMPTPGQVLDLEPVPVFISYQ